MSRLRLHYGVNSCALAVHVALEEAEADFELVRVDLAANEQQAPAFLALSPLGRVPVLETPEGVLTEVPAILGYVAATHPHAALAPVDAYGAARVNAFNGYISSTVHVAIAHRIRSYRWADGEDARRDMQAKASTNYAECFSLIDEKLLQGPCVHGDAYSTSDAYLYLVTRWLTRIDLHPSSFPRVSDHYQRMCQRPAVRRALAAQGLE